MEELQELSKKSSADRAGDKKRSDKRRIDSSSAPNGAGKKKPLACASKPDPDCPNCHGEGLIDIPAHPGRPDMTWNTVAQDCDCTIPKGSDPMTIAKKIRFDPQAVNRRSKT